METKHIAVVVGILTLLIVGGCVVSKAADSFQKFQQAQTAQLAGF